MAKLNRYIVSGHATGNWSLNVDAVSPEDAKAQVEALIDEYEEAPATVDHDMIDVNHVSLIGPAAPCASNPLRPTDIERDADFSAVVREIAVGAPHHASDEGDNTCKT